MAPLFTREVLDVMLAGLQQQEPMAVLPITQTCHPDDGMDAVYTGEGVVRLICHTCQEERARLLLLTATIPTTGAQEPLS